MLSRPATGMTSISVIAGAAFLPGRSLRAMNLLTPAVPAADGITAVKGNGDLASLDSRLHLNPDHCRLGEDRTCHASRTGGYGTETQAGKRLDCSAARISVGDLKHDVLSRCGEPTTTAVHVEARERGPRTIYETVEDWVYGLRS